MIAWLGEQTKRLLASRAGRYAAGAGLVALAAGLWLREHDARLRQAAQLSQLQKQTATDVRALQAQAEAAVREANQQRAQATRELEAREAKFAQEAQELRQRIADLQKGEQARLERVAALPVAELANRVSTRLGLPPNPSAPGPLPQQGEVGLELGKEGLRKVDQALIELDSCREQGAALDEETRNLNDQLQTGAALASQQAAAIEKLNQALQAKDRILAESQAEHRAELKAARGTRLGRLKRALEHVVLGVVIGLVLR